MLFDLIADKDLQIYQEGNSLVGAPGGGRAGVGHRQGPGLRRVSSSPRPKHTLIDDHLELQKAGIRAIDVVDFDYPAWHTPDDTIDKVSAASLQIVGDVAVALVRQEGRARSPLRRPCRRSVSSRSAPSWSVENHLHRVYCTTMSADRASGPAAARWPWRLLGQGVGAGALLARAQPPGQVSCCGALPPGSPSRPA